MEKYTNDELLDVLPSHIRELKSTILSPKQKAVLGQMYFYDGLNKKDEDGYFYRSNLDLCYDCDIKEEKTLIAAVRKLVLLGFIDTVRGSRKNKASLYRLNKKVIGDYCKTPVKDYSNDYSKQIAEMTDRIKELEITVKKIVERITVIEGKNYSTDTDIDKELDIEKDINNNIINKKSLFNNIEETVSSKGLENGDSKENLTGSQLSVEILASAPIEDLSQATPDMDLKEVEDTQASTDEESIPVKQQKIPTEEEQYQQWLQVLTSYLLELENVKTLKQFNSVKNKLDQFSREYLEKHEETSPTVIERMNKTIACALKGKKSKLLPDEMELSDYIAVMRN